MNVIEPNVKAEREKLKDELFDTLVIKKADANPELLKKIFRTAKIPEALIEQPSTNLSEIKQEDTPWGKGIKEILYLQIYGKDETLSNVEISKRKFALGKAIEKIIYGRDSCDSVVDLFGQIAFICRVGATVEEDPDVRGIISPSILYDIVFNPVKKSETPNTLKVKTLMAITEFSPDTGKQVAEMYLTNHGKEDNYISNAIKIVFFTEQEDNDPLFAKNVLEVKKSIMNRIAEAPKSYVVAMRSAADIIEAPEGKELVTDICGLVIEEFSVQAAKLLNANGVPVLEFLHKKNGYAAGIYFRDTVLHLGMVVDYFVKLFFEDIRMNGNTHEWSKKLIETIRHELHHIRVMGEMPIFYSYCDRIKEINKSGNLNGYEDYLYCPVEVAARMFEKNAKDDRGRIIFSTPPSVSPLAVFDNQYL